MTTQKTSGTTGEALVKMKLSLRMMTPGPLPRLLLLHRLLLTTKGSRILQAG